MMCSLTSVAPMLATTAMAIMPIKEHTIKQGVRSVRKVASCQQTTAGGACRGVQTPGMGSLSSLCSHGRHCMDSAIQCHEKDSGLPLQWLCLVYNA